MATVLTPAPPLVDLPDPQEWPPELRLLLGDEARGLLTAVADAAGGRLSSWAPRQVTHQPDRSTVVQYRADLARSDGTVATETIVAATGDRIPPGAAVLDDGTTKVGVWRWPFDPSLPGLQDALDRDHVGSLLDDLGIDGGTVGLRVRAYRPGRRAVIEATGRRGRLFLKIVRTNKVEELHRTHRELATHLPVPDSLGWTTNGILVMPGLAGDTLREVLRSGRLAVPAPAALDAMLDRLPDVLAGGPPRRSLVGSASHHGGVIASALPVLGEQVDDLVGDLQRRPLAEHDTVPVHGDFYEAQLLVRSGRVAGLLDVDTAGAGERIEDIANMLGHLSVLAVATDRPKPVKRYGAALLAQAEQRFDRDDLRVRVAAAVVGLATGPFRVLEARWPQATARRLELARAWLDGSA